MEKVCRPVERFDRRLHILLDDMKETLAEANGVGLAAPQVGILRRAVIVVDEQDQMIELVNPVIIRQEGEQDGWEGCLSLPGARKAKRWESIKVRYQNERFQTRFQTFTGWTAQIIQHEIDHCEGRLI